MHSKEPALKDSAPVAIPPLTTPKCLALAEKPHDRDSRVWLDLPLKSLLVAVAELGSFSIFSFSFYPIGPALSGVLPFHKVVLMAFRLVSMRERFHSSLRRGSLCFILLRTPPLLLVCFRIVYASSLSHPSYPHLQHCWPGVHASPST